MHDQSFQSKIREQEVLLEAYQKYGHCGDSSTLSRSSIRTPKNKILFKVDFNYKTGKCKYISK